MPIEIQGTRYYSPRETAKLLGVSVAMLRYHRSEGRIEDTLIGIIHYCTDEQILRNKARVYPYTEEGRRAGRKPKEPRDTDPAPDSLATVA